MTALAPLVLAAVTALTGCAVDCLDRDPIDTLDPAGRDVELPDARIDVAGRPHTGPSASMEVASVEVTVPLLSDGLLDTLTDAHLPHHRVRLSIPGHPSSEPSGAETDENATTGTTHEPSEPAKPPEHVPRHGEPSFVYGQAVHQARTDTHAHGHAVGEDATALRLSLLLGLAAVGLYHKLTKDRALEHEARRRILAMLDEQPGLGTTEIADRLEVCYRTARHHLEVLARFDLVVQAEQRGRWRWARPEDARALRTPVMPPLQERIVALLDEQPGLHLSEIARRLDVAKATAKRHVDRLDEQGCIVEQRVGPLRRFFPGQQGPDDGEKRRST